MSIDRRQSLPEQRCVRGCDVTSGIPPGGVGATDRRAAGDGWKGRRQVGRVRSPAGGVAQSEGRRSMPAARLLSLSLGGTGPLLVGTPGTCLPTGTAGSIPRRRRQRRRRATGAGPCSRVSRHLRNVFSKKIAQWGVFTFGYKFHKT